MYFGKCTLIVSTIIAINMTSLGQNIQLSSGSRFRAFLSNHTTKKPLPSLGISPKQPIARQWAIAPAMAESITDSQVETAMQLNQTGIEHYQNEQWSEALVSFEQALQIYQAIGDVRGEGYVLFNLGKVYEQLGRKEDALDAYWEVLQIADNISSRSTFNAEYEVYCNTESGSELWEADDRPIDCIQESSEADTIILFDEEAEDQIIPPSKKNN
jgi:tetratricopeptide (TPR) repeat protein